MVHNQQRCWVMKFLMGLNDSYKGIKVPILLIKPFPSLNEVYLIIQQEEKYRLKGLHLNLWHFWPKEITKKVETKHLAQKKDWFYYSFCKIPRHSIEGCFKANLGKSICSYGQVPGHVADKCFKLHEYPSSHKFEGKNRPSTNIPLRLLAVQEIVNDKAQVS